MTTTTLQKIRELRASTITAQTTLRNTACMLRKAAVEAARLGEAHTCATLLGMAFKLDDTADGRVTGKEDTCCGKA